MTRCLSVLAAFLISTTGCGTIANFATAPHGPATYGGLGVDIELAGSGGGSKGGGSLFGVLDTATLPFTVMCEIFGWRR